MEKDFTLKTLLTSSSSTGLLPVNSRGPALRAKRTALFLPDAPDEAETQQVSYISAHSAVGGFVFLTKEKNSTLNNI